MSAESQEFEYVWDFQVPGYKPETRQKTPRTLDSCKLELISFQPHTFDSIATMMNNRETSPFGLFSYIMCACCNDHKFWGWGPNQGLEEPKNCHMCPHCDAIICNRCAICHSKFSVETMNRKCKWCKKIVFPPKNRQFSPTNPIDVSDYGQYLLAGSGLAAFSYWILTKRRFDFSKIVWKFQLDTMGWRFFLTSNLLLGEEHLNQYRFLLANMLLSAKRNTKYRKIQMVYHQPRQITIMHNFAMVILQKLTRPYLLRNRTFLRNYTLKQYVHSQFAKKMHNMYGFFLKKN
jgi:hypothetical protein